MKVTFEDIIVPHYTAMWFCACSNLTTINNIEFLDTSNDTTMHGMFVGCSSLTSIDLSNFDTSNATKMKQMFQQTGLTGKLDYSTLTNKVRQKNVENTLKVVRKNVTNLKKVVEKSVKI